MAHSLSAKKRVRQNIKANQVNKARKSQTKTQIKHFEDSLESGDVNVATEQLRLTVQKLDKTASKSTMHKKTAARKKSRLTKKLNEMIAKKK